MKSAFFRFFSLCLLLCLLSGCADVADSSETSGTADGEIRIVDALGYEHILSEPPRRVAALIASLAEAWQLAGGELVAAPEDAWSDLSLELGDAICIGGAHSPNVELLLSTSPDLVLASSSTASNIELRELLVSAGIRVIYYDVDSFYDYLDMLGELSSITGRGDLYERNGASLLTRIEKVKAELGARALPENERRILLLRASSSSVKAKGSEGTVLGEMLADLGCINVADGERGILEALSVESIAAAKPYRIFVVTMGDDTEAARRSLEALINENPALSSLDAVRSGRLHIMDRRLYNIKPNARWAEAYEGLYEILISN